MISRKIITLIVMAIFTLGSFAFAKSSEVEIVEYDYALCSVDGGCCSYFLN